MQSRKKCKNDRGVGAARFGAHLATHILRDSRIQIQPFVCDNGCGGQMDEHYIRLGIFRQKTGKDQQILRFSSTCP
jgi:hypothetical protein